MVNNNNGNGEVMDEDRVREICREELKEANTALAAASMLELQKANTQLESLLNLLLRVSCNNSSNGTIYSEVGQC